MNINVQQLKNGNENAFKSIVESYWPRLHKFAQTYVLDNEVAKEIVQDTFLILWKQRKELDEDTCLITYLMVVNRNKCLNYLKSLKLETIDISELSESAIYQRSNIYVLEDESLEILVTKELQQAIDDSLEKLTLRTKEIFLLSRYEGLKNREIAEQQNISVKAVEFHINKALKQLKCDLSKDYFILFICTAILILSKK